MEEIRHNILYEENYAGVTLGALIFPRGVILIDAPLRADDCLAWNAIILSRSSQIIDNSKETSSGHALIYLDSHPDRTIGARMLETTGQIPIIIAHRATARGFESRPTIFKGQNPDTGAEWEICDDVISTRWALPDLTFEYQMCLSWEHNIDPRRTTPPIVTYSPIQLELHAGPSEGAIWVHLPRSKVVFVGDAILANQPPFLEKASLSKWIESIEILLSAEYKEYSVISGRGGVVTRNEIRAQQKYLERIFQQLNKLAQKGAAAHETEDLIPDLISKIDFSKERLSLYEQRLRYGLHSYYVRHFRPEGYVT